MGPGHPLSRTTSQPIQCTFRFRPNAASALQNSLISRIRQSTKRATKTPPTSATAHEITGDGNWDD